MLKRVNDFESLIAYLQDELDWNFRTDDIEDLTFDYEPEELGLDENTSAKIASIRQLRPLVTNQTWGIFYIDFEPKKLPVVALRRILSKLVVKRRHSANQSERASWEMHDLLFMSSCGESNTRTITFAHFSDNTGFGDLPILRTLSWDNRDTKLHLEHAHETLRVKLKFPVNPEDSDAWREQWGSAFTLRHGEVIRTSKQLAKRLAELAINIRNKANDILEVENEKGQLRKLHKAFKEALISDLTYDDFADMYAQTVSYGLLTARISRQEGIVADNLADMIVAVANPFLKEQLKTFIHVAGRTENFDFDELGINDVVEMLRDADMDAVLRDFGDKNPNEDPAIHFYELFLKEYDPEKRMKRGVFYTPRPVVSFIVRSVHEILQKEFGLADGLADTTTWGEMKERNGNLEIPKNATESAPFVQILDPATGTGTFLVEVINVIDRTMKKKWKSDGKSGKEIHELWNDYVPNHLLPRLFGFELMMAPYSIAHMKIGLKLRETGYSFLSSERAKIYLTNTLEKPHDLPPYFKSMAPALAHEAEAANKVKKQKPITVVIGNPPYSGISSNLSDEARKIVDSYRYVNGEKIKEKGALQFEKNLQDDYVKFYSWSEKQIINQKTGILALITNHGFLDSLTLRGMRWNLLKTFNNLYFIDLQGSTKRPLESDQNVFDIQQGVSISFLVQSSFRNLDYKNISKSDLIGSRKFKYDTLSSKTMKNFELSELQPLPPFFQFLNLDSSVQKEYRKNHSLIELFSVYSSGVETGFDALLVGLTKAELQSNLEVFLDDSCSDSEIKESFSITGGTAAKLLSIRESFRKDYEKNMNKYSSEGMYRLFDNRHYYLKKEYLKTNSFNVMQHLWAGKNIALVAFRQQSQNGFQHIFLTEKFGDKNAVSLRTREINYYFPLYLYPTPTDKNFGITTRIPNFSDQFIEELSEKLNLKLEYDDGETENPLIVSGSPNIFTPEDVFHYAYAAFHSPTYRSRYADFLKIDFPRLPLTDDKKLFRKLGALGAKLVALHLLESVDVPKNWKLHTDKTALFEDADVAPGYPKKDLFDKNEKGIGKVYINKQSWFANVPDEVWKFHIGGYQVCHKWLKDRKGRTLSEEDIAHYGKITVALAGTIRLMAEIDEIIEKHGGFPIVGSQKESETVA